MRVSPTWTASASGPWPSIRTWAVSAVRRSCSLKDDPELMLACVRAYNDFLIDWISPDPRRFVPICATPFWDVAASVAEIERCAKPGHKGVLFTRRAAEPRHADPRRAATGTRSGPRRRPAICPSASTSARAPSTTASRPSASRRWARAASNAVAAISLFLDNGKQLTDLLFSGVLPRFPELKFLSVESRDRLHPVHPRGRRLHLRVRRRCARRTRSSRSSRASTSTARSTAVTSSKSTRRAS